MGELRDWRNQITNIRRELRKLEKWLKELEDEISAGVDE
jgi:predicted  nucleic acid-binding Zn-ribbon protein